MTSKYKDARIWVAGHRGLVGSALLRRLRAEGADNLILRSRAELDLTDRQAVESFFTECQPEYVFLAAAQVGGIAANNDRPVAFLRDNLLIQTHVIDAARRHGARKLLFLGSSCIYPKNAPQPMREEFLLGGHLEPTNQWYAVAKIAGIKLCQAYRRQYGFDAVCAMPTNLYGPNDNFDLETSHVLPALIRKCHEAKLRGDDEVLVWGTGNPTREFLHVDDLANACLFLMEHYDAEDIVNVGAGEDISIADLADTVADIVGFEGRLVYDTSKPDGAPGKLLDISRLTELGWRAQISLSDGIRSVYEQYQHS